MYSLMIRRVIRYLLPVAASESNPNIYQECVKVLQCGTQHFRSLAGFVLKRRDTQTAQTLALESAAASCRALASASFQLVFYRSVELHPQKLLRSVPDQDEDDDEDHDDGHEEEDEGVLQCRWNLYAVVPALICPPGTSDGAGAGEGGLGCVRLRRTTNSMLCAVESFLYIAAECSSSSLPPATAAATTTAEDSATTLSSFLRQPLRIYGITTLTEYFHYVNSEPVVSLHDRYLNNKSLGTPTGSSASTSGSASGSMNWRGREAGSGGEERQQTTSAAGIDNSSDANSVVHVSSYVGLLLDKCALMFRREEAAAATSAADSGAARDTQDKLKAALHRTVLTICQVRVTYLYMYYCDTRHMNFV